MSSSTGSAERMRVSVTLFSVYPERSEGSAEAQLCGHAHGGCSGGTSLGSEYIQRQRHRDRRSETNARRHIDSPAVLLHDAIRDGHAEPCAGRKIRTERLEQPRHVALGHSAAAVGEDDVVGTLVDVRTHIDEIGREY